MASTLRESSPAGQLAQALVDYSLDGAFPEEKVSSLLVDPEALPPAIEALANAKLNLQVLLYLPKQVALPY